MKKDILIIILTVLVVWTHFVPVVYNLVDYIIRPLSTSFFCNGHWEKTITWDWIYLKFNFGGKCVNLIKTK